MGQQDKLNTGVGPGDKAASAAPARPYRVRWWGQFGVVDARSGKDLLPRGRRAQAILDDLAAYCEMQRGSNKFAIAEAKIVELCVYQEGKADVGSVA